MKKLITNLRKFLGFWKMRFRYFLNYDNFWTKDGQRDSFENYPDEIQNRQENFFKKIDLELNPKNVLDVGCGYGRILKLFGERGTGIDFGEQQVKKGEALKIIKGDITKEIPFPDNSFDLVYTVGVLMHIPPFKVGRARDEIYRVAKKYILLVESIDKNYHMFGYDNTKWLKEKNCKIIKTTDETEYPPKKKNRKMRVILAEKI